MAITKEKVYRKNPNIVTRKIEDEMILVPIKRDAADLEAIYNLNNEVSVKIWELIDGKRSIGDIKHKILEEFQVKEEKLEKDLKEFVKDLKEIEAIR